MWDSIYILHHSSSVHQVFINQHSRPFFFVYIISCSPDWLSTHYIAEGDFVLTVSTSAVLTLQACPTIFIFKVTSFYKWNCIFSSVIWAKGTSHEAVGVGQQRINSAAQIDGLRIWTPIFMKLTYQHLIVWFFFFEGWLLIITSQIMVLKAAMPPFFTPRNTKVYQSLLQTPKTPEIWLITPSVYCTDYTHWPLLLSPAALTLKPYFQILHRPCEAVFYGQTLFHKP